MKIPSHNQCFQIIRKMGMMDHIIDHSIMVGNVTLCLCRHVNQTSPLLNIHLATAAALLHDITKTRSFKTGERHSETGGELLKTLGYPEIGEIIRQHVVLDGWEKDTPVTEQEIVNYADKRVLHDTIVPLAQRLEYIQDTYGHLHHLQDRIARMWRMTRALENKLFRRISFSPAQLSDRVLMDIRFF